MTSFKSTLLLSGLLVSMAGVAGAADTWTMPNPYLEQVSEMLAADGYTSIRAVDGKEARLIAFDADGSEVLLTMHSDNGTIRSTDYVHAMDR